MKVSVLDRNGKSTGKEVTLPKSLFEVEPNDHALYLVVKNYLANQRQGTHKAKERGEIAGSTRKIKKQKGTGTARAGSLKNPLFRSGGTVFGPRPRNYGVKINKKVKQLARASALTYKAKDSAIVVVNNLEFDAPKTKDFTSMMSAINVDAKSLFVTGELNKNALLSVRNLPKTKLTSVESLSTYDVMNANHIVFTEDALKKIAE
ncbi:MAG: 50S ribosomal protein L4 [Saprospiraceae bacterium]|nr:50S ribosomal protein L4 [Saprospiraceae bacterium]